MGYATNGQAPIRGVCHQHRPEYGDFYHPTSHLTILKRSQSQCPTVPAMIPVGATANVAVSKQSMTVQCRSAQCHTAPTAQHGLLFHGNMIVLGRSTARCPGTLLVRSLLFGGSTTAHRKSAARCPGTFSAVSYGRASVHDRSADQCSGTYNPVRSPCLRECNRTVQCRSADRCSGTFSAVSYGRVARTVQLCCSVPRHLQHGLPRECDRTPQICGSVPRHLQPSTVSLLAGV